MFEDKVAGLLAYRVEGLLFYGDKEVWGWLDREVE